MNYSVNNETANDGNFHVYLSHINTVIYMMHFTFSSSIKKFLISNADCWRVKNRLCNTQIKEYAYL